MNQVWERIRQWWGDGQTVAAPFEVACRCGAMCRGQRQKHHQETRCPACQRLVFVLPQSALGQEGNSLSFASRAQQPWPIWLAPLLAGSLSLLACVAVYFLILRSLVNSPPPDNADPRQTIQDRVAAARSALSREDFPTARNELLAARAALEQSPGALTATDLQPLHQLWSEVDLMASWAGEPLDLIVTRNMKLKEEEWQAVAANRYVGRGMVFDVIVRRDAAGLYSTTFRREAANQLLRLQLHNQSLLKYLPLNEPQRLLLGARLAEIRRDDKGFVLVRLEPDSCVLLTEAAVISACAPAVDTAGLPEVTERQRRWVLDLPANDKSR